MIDENKIKNKSLSILKNFYGEDASFNPGQLESIVSSINNNKTLVIEKTGWGKSLVYFIATKILRDMGSGPTIIISPLRSLMDNQIESAKKVNLNIEKVNYSVSSGKNYEIMNNLNNYDGIIVAPEKLKNMNFVNKIRQLNNISLLVIDEVHSLSEWGNDFRPDYQRISDFISYLPKTLSVIGTTATANNKVISDINKQLGNNINIIRGDLMRNKLAIQVNPRQSAGERLAWISNFLNNFEQIQSDNAQGIIYCLTTKDCRLVSDFLKSQNIDAEPYYSQTGEENLINFENGKLRVLVSTIKLGMGFDMSNIRFIIHYQLPQNLISYYQQIGRAGRDGKGAYVFLLHDGKDIETLKILYNNSSADAETLQKILNLASVKPVQINDLLNDIELNIDKETLETAISYLNVHNYIIYITNHENRLAPYYKTNPNKKFDLEKEKAIQNNIIKSKDRDLDKLSEFINTKECYMHFILNELDAPDKEKNCGNCTNCLGENNYLYYDEVPEDSIKQANTFLNNHSGIIRLKNRHIKNGWVLANDYVSQIGQEVKKGKYQTPLGFSDHILELSINYLKSKIQNDNIDLVIPIPSSNSNPKHRNLVPNFTEKLAHGLNIEYLPAASKISEGVQEKELKNDILREQNINNTIHVDGDSIQNRNILLVDDMIDSGVTFDVVGEKLLKAGATSVYPFSLTRTGHND